MAEHGMFQVNELLPHLADRGIDLSPSHVWRIVHGKSNRVSLPVLAALCDIFNASPADLIVITAQTIISNTAEDTAADVVDPANLRPTRARIRPDR
jgi:DNA-binding Xre family transcriptional regulator